MRRILILFAVVSVISLGIGYYMYNMPPKNLAKIEADVVVSAEELMSQFEENEEMANEMYLGKVIEVKGEISDVKSTDDGSVQIFLESESLMGGISCNFDSEELAKPNTPQSGQSVIIKGKCSGFLMDVVLERCVVVELME